ncbi:nucleotidyltransferase family protein [Ancylobacter sp. IITR112]|uniref:nucleotidyltransferase family protein n=1 Tax=Ancylobacter sp. IITR112 TaxID=3138073 RepID=UPI00352A60FE
MSHPNSVDALRRLCVLLSPFSTTEAARAAAATMPSWPAALAQADMHRLIPAFHVALARHGLADAVDAELAEVLAAVADWNTERNTGFRRQMRVVSAAFNAAGLEPVWLKGALTLLPPDGPAAGRQMMDLDVWLPEESRQRAAMTVLNGLGYGFQDGLGGCARHYPPFFHPEEMARIELHRTIVDPDETLLPVDEAAAGLVMEDWEGLRIAQLDPLSRALCSLAQCTDRRPDRLGTAEVPLMKALDFVGRIHADFGGVVPPALVERAVRAGWERSTQRFLTLTDSYFGLPNPFPSDPELVRLLERFTRRPRWHHTLKAARSLFGTGGWAALRAPGKAANMAAYFVGRLLAPDRPAKL